MATYDPAVAAKLPAVAQRCFARADAPGTPLRTTAGLETTGTFLLGDASSHQTYSMRARRILRPPHEFVWMPRLRSVLGGRQGGAT